MVSFLHVIHQILYIYISPLCNMPLCLIPPPRIFGEQFKSWCCSGPYSESREFSPRSYYTGCPRRNVPDFGRVFLMLKYIDVTPNTYIQSWTVTEIMPREKCGLLAVSRTAPVQLTRYVYTAQVIEMGMQSTLCLRYERLCSRLIPKCAVSKVKSVLQYCWIFMCHVKCLEP